MLPLMHADNTMDRVIGAMSVLTSPHWLGYEHLTTKRLIDHDLIWPDGRPRSIIERTGQRGAVPAGATRGAHGQERAAPVSRFRRRPQQGLSGSSRPLSFLTQRLPPPDPKRVHEFSLH